MDSTTRRIMRGCAIFMTLAAAGLVLAYGFTWWAVAGALLLLACPVAVFWGIARLDEGQRPDAGTSSTGGSP